MNLDVFTLAALVDQLLDTVVGGRVQDTLLVDEWGIGLEIYANRTRHYLYASADNQTPRVHLVSDKLRRGVTKPTPLGLLLRRHVEGALVLHVSQPAWDRILHLELSHPETGVSLLIIEPMPRRANILLVQAGIILDCARRVGADDNRYRVSLPNQPYIPPPPQTGKLDPFTITREALIGAFAQNDDPKRKAAQVLSARVLGMSPLLASEVVHRTGLNVNAKADDADPDAIYAALVETVAPLKRREWQPGVIARAGLAEGFSVYPITHREGWQPATSISVAMETFYTTPTGEEAYTAAKQRARGELAESKAKLEAKLASLRRSLTDESERDDLRQSGELILAYQYTLEAGQTELRAQYDADAPELVISIDPTMTPLENAQRYFDRYNRAKRALDDVPRLIEETAGELAYLDQLATDLDLAANWVEIDEVQQTLQAKGYWRGKPAARIAGGSKTGPLRVVSRDGFVIWVGRNSRQNETVTFDKGSPIDTWLHARGVAGAHVIIKQDGRANPEDVILLAASLAAHYSASKTEASVIVDVTERRHVRKIKGAAAGMVTYRNETTRTVAPRDERALRDEGLLA